MDITGRVIMSLETYDKLNSDLNHYKTLSDELTLIIGGFKKGEGMFKANRLGSMAYIELDKKGVELVNNMASEFSGTHEIRQVTVGETIVSFRENPKLKGDSDA